MYLTIVYLSSPLNHFFTLICPPIIFLGFCLFKINNGQKNTILYPVILMIFLNFLILLNNGNDQAEIYFLSFFLAVFIFTCIYKLENFIGKYRSILAFFSNFSFSIYLFHPIILSVLLQYSIDFSYVFGFLCFNLFEINFLNYRKKY